jgi:DNA adenine methylase
MDTGVSKMTEVSAGLATGAGRPREIHLCAAMAAYRQTGTVRGAAVVIGRIVGATHAAISEHPKACSCNDVVISEHGVRGPVGRYHGGKFRDAKWIISHMPPHERVDIYGEPFCGMASVFFQMERVQTEVLNDLDGELVNVFRVLQDPVRAAQLERRVRATPYSRAEYARAVRLTGCGDEVARAWAVIVRSYMGFGSDSAAAGQSGFRSGVRKGSGGSKAPVGSEWARYPDRIAAFRERLATTHLESEPAVRMIERYDSPRTMWYVDPPYVRATRSPCSFRKGKGYKHEMTDQDHRELAGCLRASRGYVLLSGYASELYAEMYDGWFSVTKSTYAHGAEPRTEVLWLNPAAAAASPALRTGGAGAEPDLFAA